MGTGRIGHDASYLQVGVQRCRCLQVLLYASSPPVCRYLEGHRGTVGDPDPAFAIPPQPPDFEAPHPFDANDDTDYPDMPIGGVNYPGSVQACKERNKTCEGATCEGAGVQGPSLRLL